MLKRDEYKAALDKQLELLREKATEERQDEMLDAFEERENDRLSGLLVISPVGYAEDLENNFYSFQRYYKYENSLTFTDLTI